MNAAAISVHPGYEPDSEFELHADARRFWTRDTLRQLVERVLGRKRFIAARTDGDGVLVLSTFTGAARELEQSVQLNPYATDETAAALHQALSMEESERHTRMAALRESVAHNNIYRWAGKLVSELGRIASRHSLELNA